MSTCQLREVLNTAKILNVYLPVDQEESLTQLNIQGMPTCQSRGVSNTAEILNVYLPVNQEESLTQLKYSMSAYL